LNGLLKALRSSIGKKILMAATGLAFMGFLATHVAANLLLLVDRDAFNGYAHALAGNKLLYAAEAFLAAVFIIHFVYGIRVWMGNKAARPVAYHTQTDAVTRSPATRKSLASKLMIVSGIWILIFLPIHIKMFKFGEATLLPDGSKDLAKVVVDAYQSPLIVMAYAITMLVVGLHLWHAFGSALQTLGVNHKRYTPIFNTLGKILAVVMAGGFFVIPVAIYFGLGV
jgi:succinate dehydrogenase / fumarate reductase cytochrome b subunit